LTQAAQKLKTLKDNWIRNDPEFDRALTHGLQINQRIWTILQSELANPDHPMPKKIRIDLLRLSAFVDKRTYEVLAFPEPDKLQILIDINLNIAAGLRQTPTAMAQPTEAPPIETMTAASR